MSVHLPDSMFQRSTWGSKYGYWDRKKDTKTFTKRRKTVKSKNKQQRGMTLKELNAVLHPRGKQLP